MNSYESGLLLAIVSLITNKKPLYLNIVILLENLNYVLHKSFIFFD